MADFTEFDDDLNLGAGPLNTDFLEDEDVLAQPDLGQEEEEEDAFLAEAERDSPPPPEATQPQQAASPQPAAGPSDIKAKLAALVQKKREEAGEGKAKKRSKGEKGDKGDGEKKKKKKGSDGEKAGKRADRPRREPGAGDDEGGAKRARGSDEDGPQVSIDSQDIQADEADKEFIDDEADFGGEQISDDEDARLAAAPQAEDGEDMLFGRKKKKRREEDSDKQMSLTVDDKIAKMEAAAELDYEARDAGKPAVNKLKMLREVEDFLAQLLPIDTTRDDIKENLKKSQLGSRVMFLANCQEESQQNRKLATELVHKWARPIFFDPDAEAEKKRLREEAIRRAREASRAHEQNQETIKQSQGGQDPSKIRYGQQGYRWHASIPQPLKLDYVVAPQSQLATNPESAVSQAALGIQQANAGRKETGRFDKKMREVLRRQKGSTARAAVPSVEGRNLHV